MEVQYSSDSNSDGESRDERTVDLSNLELTTETLTGEMLDQRKSRAGIEIVLLNSNRLTSLSALRFAPFNQLRVLNISNNHITKLPEYLLELPLTTIIARNNKLSNESLPKSLFSKTAVFRELNFGGNLFAHFPEQLLQLQQLKYLYLGEEQEFDEDSACSNKILFQVAIPSRRFLRTCGGCAA